MANQRGIPGARRSAERPRAEWRDYQQPLRWDWSAFAVVVVLLVLGTLLALHVTGRL